MTVPWLPDGFHTITPNIIADDADQLIGFLKRAFGAVENYRLTLANGSITHCELKIGNSVLSVGATMEGWPAHRLVAQVFSEKPDALFKQALAAGATVLAPIANTFFGVREGRLSDPFGNTWIIAALTERITPQEMQRRLRAEGY